MLAAVSGRSAAGPVRPVTDILMAAGADGVDHSGRSDLLIKRISYVQSIVERVTCAAFQSRQCELIPYFAYNLHQQLNVDQIMLRGMPYNIIRKQVVVKTR